MLIRKLDELFYRENTHLVEVLDLNANGRWTEQKQRGYGIVLCEYNSLRFGIHLRSHLKHKHGMKTIGSKGLDYGKAVLLTKDSWISSLPFRIPDQEFRILQNKEQVIRRQFSKYIAVYVKGCTRQDHNILREYRFSTLQNYPSELGIDIPAIMNPHCSRQPQGA